MAVSHVLVSVLGRRRGDSSVHAALRRCRNCRGAFPMVEINLPATILKDHAIAERVREQRMAVEVGTGADVAVALAAGIHPSRMTVHADGLDDAELSRVVQLGVGRMVLSSARQADLVAAAGLGRRQSVLLRLTGWASADVAELMGVLRVNLAGLHGELGPDDPAGDGRAAAIAHLVAEMALIGRRHGVVLGRLGLGIPSANWAEDLAVLVGGVDGSADDACASLRFPRPLVALSAGTGSAIAG